LFLDALDKICSRRNIVATTEDGSYGMKCLATAPLESVLAEEEFDMVYACGPEQMLRKAYELTENHGLPLEVSLERLMRCAIGLCGTCVLGKYRVCRDGPVFTSKQLREVETEFGNSKLGFDGKRIPL
jgi:dihydroorotate dehydrogenase electron transfer subunit